jgi:hypothetical protein
MTGVWDCRYEAAVPTTVTLSIFIIIRKQYIANTQKSTYSEKQKSILKFVQSRLHVRSKDAYLRRDGFSETFHLRSEVAIEAFYLRV